AEGTRTMAAPAEGDAEIALLRLLLDDGRVDPDDLDWSLILKAAVRHGMLLRLAAWFDRRHEEAPAPIAEAIGHARDRLQCVIGLVARLEERCARREIDHVFLKFAQQFPDVGKDLDLLVTGNAPGIDAELLDRDPAQAPKPNLRGRLAGTTSYPVPECDIT